MAELTSWGWGIDSNSWMGLSGDKKTHSALVGDKKTHGSLDEHREETNPQEVCFRCKLQKLRFWMNLDLNLTACPLCDLRQISCPPPQYIVSLSVKWEQKCMRKSLPMVRVKLWDIHALH